MVFTMAEIWVPFTAAHVHWDQLAIYLDVSKGGSPDWARLADLLGFSYDEIAQIKVLFDVTGSNTIKMFDRYVARSNGGCLYTVMNAIQSLERYDALEVLYRNMKDIKKRAHAMRHGMQGRSNDGKQNTCQDWLKTDDHLTDPYCARMPTRPVTDRQYNPNRQSPVLEPMNLSCRNGPRTHTNPPIPIDPSTAPARDELSPFPYDRSPMCRSPMDSHLWQQNGMRSESPMDLCCHTQNNPDIPINLSNRGPKNGMHSVSNSQTPYAHIRSWIQNVDTIPPGYRHGVPNGHYIPTEDTRYPGGVVPNWDLRDDQGSMEVEIDSSSNCTTHVEDGVMYSNQEHPASVPDVLIRYQLEQNCYSPHSISVGAEEEVTTSEESIDSPVLAREKYGWAIEKHCPGKTMDPQASRRMGLKDKAVREARDLQDAPTKAKQLKTKGRLKDGRGDVPVDSRPGCENARKVAFRKAAEVNGNVGHDVTSRASSLPEPPTERIEPSTSKKSESHITQNRHSWPEMSTPQSATPKPGGQTKQSKSLLCNFQPNPSRKVPLEVLITYARDSDAHVNEVLCLYRCLKKNGFRVKLDLRDKEMGDNITGWVDTNFNKASFIIICISPEYKRAVDFNGKKGQLDKHQQCCRYIHTRMLTEYWQNTCCNERFRPLLFPGANVKDMPGWLHNTLAYKWRDQWKDVLYSMIRPHRVVKILADNIEGERPRITRYKM